MWGCADYYAYLAARGRGLQLSDLIKTCVCQETLYCHICRITVYDKQYTCFGINRDHGLCDVTSGRNDNGNA